LTIPIGKREYESGQATVMVIAAMSIFLLGAVGLAIDGSHLYAQRQMAQAAADAAAQAGILSLFDGTGGMGTHTAGTAFTCATGDAATPCKYAQSINGFGTASDTVSVSFPDAAGAGISASSLSGSDPVAIIRVTVQRAVNTTLIRFLGPATATIKASGTAAIVEVPSAIPIIVTHPGLPTKGGTLSFNGNPNITITGGPPKSVQVNSGNSGAIDITSCGNAFVDLSKAGPKGTGASFGNSGGPASPCFKYNFGCGLNTRPCPSGTNYQQPSSAITDPLAGVPVPTTTGLTVNPATQPKAFGANGCAAAAGCTMYSPGVYNTANGITVKNQNALFAPGMYYITQGGFNMLSNSTATMATGVAADPQHPEIGDAGMVVFNSGTGNNDIFNFVANAGASSPGIVLHGPPDDSIWDGILFYEDPTSAGGSHTGLPGGNPGHQVWGGGTLSLTGTIYINSRSGVTSSSYQALTLGGAAGSSTTVTGEIIVNTLSLGGGGTINMNLSSVTRLVRQVALVQ
jgi:Flp pilus assembly protein TadG